MFSGVFITSGPNSSGGKVIGLATFLILMLTPLETGNWSAPALSFNILEFVISWSISPHNLMGKFFKKLGPFKNDKKLKWPCFIKRLLLKMVQVVWVQSWKTLHCCQFQGCSLWRSLLRCNQGLCCSIHCRPRCYARGWKSSKRPTLFRPLAYTVWSYS